MKPDIDSHVQEQHYYKTNFYIIYMNPMNPVN